VEGRNQEKRHHHRRLGRRRQNLPRRALGGGETRTARLQRHCAYFDWSFDSHPELARADLDEAKLIAERRPNATTLASFATMSHSSTPAPLI